MQAHENMMVITNFRLYKRQKIKNKFYLSTGKKIKEYQMKDSVYVVFIMGQKDNPLQGIFPTQRWNLGALHCRQILYHLSHQGSSNAS